MTAAMDESTHRTKRLIALAACTLVSLACGTNYAYSAWGPQFAQKLQLSNTESNLIGAAGNIGMYASGIPLGYMVDKRGPHLNTVLGSFALALGYYPLLWAYQQGPGSMGVVLLFFFSFLTGAGSCSAFQAAIKTAALNWPLHRGTATAFPLAAFGLSAFFFTGLSGIFFPDSTSKYLLFLCIGTFCMVFFPVYFIYVPHAEQYTALATSEHSENGGRRNSNAMHRSRSWRGATSDPTKPAGTSGEAVVVGQANDADEASSLLSNDSVPGDIGSIEAGMKDSMHLRSHDSDLTGLALLPTIDFWLLFMMLGILTGIGLMTINNIGNDSNALWRHYAPDRDKNYILRRQLMHVSVISITSFGGRLLSGIGSDFLVKRMHKSRFWCLVASASIFAVAQFAALNVENPNHLWLLSSISGLGYGALFGVYPALVADAFGVSGLSLNWGFMTMAPVIWGNIFNLIYGRIYDAHSITRENGELICEAGIECYRSAYVLTSIASVVSIALSLGTVWRDGRKMRQARETAREGRLD